MFLMTPQRNEKINLKTPSLEGIRWASSQKRKPFQRADSLVTKTSTFGGKMWINLVKPKKLTFWIPPS